MKAYFCGLALVSLFLISCENNSNSAESEEQERIIIVNHPDDVGKYGEGTYINTNSEYTDADGNRWHRDNIFAPRPGESMNDESYKNRNKGNGYRSSGGNQYRAGYEQGQEDARQGLDPDPSGYGGNGQFEKGYEDGYEDW